MDMLEALLSRHSTPRLIAPAPSSAETERVLKAALAAPDHGCLKPWRFVVIQGKGRERLGKLFVAGAQATAGDGAQVDVDRYMKMSMRAPMIIAAIAKTRVHKKIPVIEQVISTGAAVQNMQLAATAMGYASMWRTGALAYNDVVKRGLGADPEDVIVGFLYVGTQAAPHGRHREYDIAAHCDFWVSDV